MRYFRKQLPGLFSQNVSVRVCITHSVLRKHPRSLSLLPHSLLLTKEPKTANDSSLQLHLQSAKTTLATSLENRFFHTWHLVMNINSDRPCTVQILKSRSLPTQVQNISLAFSRSLYLCSTKEKGVCASGGRWVCDTCAMCAYSGTPSMLSRLLCSATHILAYTSGSSLSTNPPGYLQSHSYKHCNPLVNFSIWQANKYFRVSMYTLFVPALHKYGCWEQWTFESPMPFLQLLHLFSTLW